uniref:Phosphate transporter n=1 Tax=Ciona savignyi TaxID=51511 RepID=H2ZJV0_CIOSA
WSNESLVWILIVGFIIAFVLAFAVGANDVANSFGTTVGANVLTLKQACVLATIFETAGAVLIGAKVGETIRKGIIDVTVYDDVNNGVLLLMLGELSAMFGSAVWQLVATLFKLPVSGTHSIVGACIGFSLVAVGSTGVNWPKLGLIVASWFISPVLSGALSVLLFLFVKYTILGKSNPLKNGLRLLPIFYAITIGINVFSIVHSGAPLIGLDKLPWWASVVMGVGVALLTGVLVLILAVPRIRRKAENAQIASEALQLTDKLDSRLDDSGYQTPNSKPPGYSWVCQIIVPQTILCFFYKSKHYYPQSTHADNLMEKVGELPEDRQFRVQLLSDSSSSCSEGNKHSFEFILLKKCKLKHIVFHNSGIAAADVSGSQPGPKDPERPNGPAVKVANTVRRDSKRPYFTQMLTTSGRQDLADTESNDVRNQVLPILVIKINRSPKLQPNAVKYTYYGCLHEIKAFHYIPFGYDMTAIYSNYNGVYFASFLSHAHPLISQDDDHEGDDGAAVRELFSPLQVLTACFASFAHGGNDVSNAIGPLIALWIVFWSGEVTQKAFTPWYLLIYGGFGICIGLWLMGKRVIETIGKNLTKVTPSRGFCIELMTAVTVLVASNVGLPVSTTHCKVGSVVSIGWLRSRAAVDWSLVRNIALAWFVTVPVSGLLSAGVMWVLMQVVL